MMADDTNEDSWLYGTSNPDSTTNEEERAGETVATVASVIGKAENEALAAVQGGEVNTDDVDNGEDQEEEEADMGEFEDPAHEMEEDEEAVAASTATTTTTDEVKAEEDQVVYFYIYVYETFFMKMIIRKKQAQARMMM